MSTTIHDWTAVGEKIKAAIRQSDIFSRCPGNRWQVEDAFLSACLAKLSEGWDKPQAEKDRLKRHAETIKKTLKYMNEHHAILEHNLEGRVIIDPETGKSVTFCPWLIPDSPVGAGPVLNSVMSVMNLLADDLVERIPSQRENVSFYSLLGAEFGKAGLPKPEPKERREMELLFLNCAGFESGKYDKSNAKKLFDSAYSNFIQK